MLPPSDVAAMAVEADWSREAKGIFEWAPSRSLIASIRRYQRHAERRTPWGYALRKVAILQHRFWSVVTGADIPVNSRFGGGLLLPHPNGIVVHPDTEIGVNCTLLQQVTLAGARRIGRNVTIGAGAKILHGVTIGNDAIVGANAVVTRDIPTGAMVDGIPARPVAYFERQKHDLGQGLAGPMA